MDDLPLHGSVSIHEGNALRTDWNDTLLADRCSYVLGDPPFEGARERSREKLTFRRLLEGWRKQEPRKCRLRGCVVCPCEPLHEAIPLLC
ncbi:DNA methyltransferase [Neoactinobaculum massilliense]|uniref:DNA methyltransferase n=1 Tax=Neoactinobaculum massilliense TaxID=2364794 RepID=UPI003B967F25